MLNKHLYCKYNVNRESVNIVHPYCKYPIPDIILPPNIGFVMKHNITVHDCKQCKCFVNTNETTQLWSNTNDTK